MDRQKLGAILENKVNKKIRVIKKVIRLILYSKKENCSESKN